MVEAHVEVAETERWLDSMISAPAERSDDFVVTEHGRWSGKDGRVAAAGIGFTCSRTLGPGYAAKR